MQRLTANVYVETAFQGANTSFVTTSQGVVMIDTPQKPTDALKWRAEIAKRGEIRYIINTEPHIDHILGNYFFPGTVASHQGTREAFAISLGSMEQVRERVKQIDPEGLPLMEGYEPRPPTITFSERLNLYLGSLSLQLIHLVGHTPSELAVYIPEEGVLCTGDNVVNKIPPYFLSSRPLEWVETLKKLEAMDVAMIVPGHGEVCDKGAIRELAAFLSEGIEAVKKAIDQGLTKEEALDRVSALKRYPLVGGVEVDLERRQSGIARIYDALVKRPVK